MFARAAAALDNDAWRVGNGAGSGQVFERDDRLIHPQVLSAQLFQDAFQIHILLFG